LYREHFSNFHYAERVQAKKYFPSHSKISEANTERNAFSASISLRTPHSDGLFVIFLAQRAVSRKGKVYDGMGAAA
jgi:hypothetical protein